LAIRDIIASKRDGGDLSREEIRAAIQGCVSGSISDAQTAALLMAILLRGMTAEETAEFTSAMVDSGERLDLSSVPGIKVDKHSTGGVGDKTTLVVAPLVASLGVPVPKMSGRALGHTGGTIDKLESVPGVTTALSPERFCRQVAEIGVAIAEQTDRMVPADRKLYALRDATSTIESPPLIASSIMSKKLAVGADAIVLDVKAGKGAFMADVEQARELAEAMVDIGRRAGRRTSALVTRMDQPLGMAVGDAVELIEAFDTLAGSGPADFADLCELIAGHMLALGGGARGPDEGRVRARQAIASGQALAKLGELLVAQGGGAEVLDDPRVLIRQTVRVPVEMEEEGYVVGVNARIVGLAVAELKLACGGKRPVCGMLLHKKVGDLLEGDPVATALGPREHEDALTRAAARVRTAFNTAASAPSVPQLLAAVVS
jgi:pyrimidine-nucleoside phosphorylase